MKNVEAIQIEGFEFVTQKIGDLIEYEGPLLSLFIDQNNPSNYFLYKWADNDERFNRWIVFQLNANKLALFFNKKVSLRELFLGIPFTFIIDMNNSLEMEKVFITSTNKLPEAYLPTIHSFYSEEKYTEFAKVFKDIVLSNNDYFIFNHIYTQEKFIDTYTLLNIMNNNSIHILDFIFSSHRNGHYSELSTLFNKILRDNRIFPLLSQIENELSIIKQNPEKYLQDF